jgi:hypothetical protein
VATSASLSIWSDNDDLAVFFGNFLEGIKAFSVDTVIVCYQYPHGRLSV